jgi:hypothetical protein
MKAEKSLRVLFWRPGVDGHIKATFTGMIGFNGSGVCLHLLPLGEKTTMICNNKTFGAKDANMFKSLNLARIYHQDHGSRRRVRVQKRCSGAKSVAIATA